MKIKENEKRDKYLDLARELKMQWNVTVTGILIVTGARGTIPKGLVRAPKGLEIEVRAITSKLQHC